MCLVSYCGCYDKEVVSSAIDQMHDFIDWKVGWYMHISYYRLYVD